MDATMATETQATTTTEDEPFPETLYVDESGDPETMVPNEVRGGFEDGEVAAVYRLERVTTAGAEPVHPEVLYVPETGQARASADAGAFGLEERVGVYRLERVGIVRRAAGHVE